MTHEYDAKTKGVDGVQAECPKNGVLNCAVHGYHNEDGWGCVDGDKMPKDGKQRWQITHYWDQEPYNECEDYYGGSPVRNHFRIENQEGGQITFDSWTPNQSDLDNDNNYEKALDVVADMLPYLTSGLNDLFAYTEGDGDVTHHAYDYVEWTLDGSRWPDAQDKAIGVEVDLENYDYNLQDIVYQKLEQKHVYGHPCGYSVDYYETEWGTYYASAEIEDSNC